MKKCTVITGACALLCAASVFLFYGFRSGRDECAHLVREPANVGLLKKEVRNYRASGAWDNAIECEVSKAKYILEHYVPAPDEKPAVIFDIDDTALSNWQFIASSDFGYDHDRNKAWENSAQDTAIEPIQELYLVALAKRFAVFFITGRREAQRKFTERNLEKVGYTQWAGAFFKPSDFGGTSAVEHKTKWRAYIESLGYTLVLNIGDQQSDLDGKPEALYNIKIANPAYFIP